MKARACGRVSMVLATCLCLAVLASCGHTPSSGSGQQADAHSSLDCSLGSKGQGLPSVGFDVNGFSQVEEYVLKGDDRPVNVAVLMGGGMAVAEVSPESVLRLRMLDNQRRQATVDIGVLSDRHTPDARVVQLAPTPSGGLILLWASAPSGGGGDGTEVVHTELSHGGAVLRSRALATLQKGEPWLYSLSDSGTVALGRVQGTQVVITRYDANDEVLWTDTTAISSGTAPALSASDSATYLLGGDQLTAWTPDGHRRRIGQLNGSWDQVSVVSGSGGGGMAEQVLLAGRSPDRMCLLSADGHPLGPSTSGGSPYGYVKGFGGSQGVSVLNKESLTDAEVQSLIGLDSTGQAVNSWIVGSSGPRTGARVIAAGDRTDEGGLVLVGWRSERTDDQYSLSPRLWILAPPAGDGSFGSIPAK